MPKTNVGKSVKVSPLEAKRRLLRSKLAGKGLNQGDLAAKLGITEGTVSKKLKRMAWSLEELVILNRLLEFTADDLEKLVA